MKTLLTLLAIAMFLNGCATTPPKQDKLLSEITHRILGCSCVLTSPEIKPSQITWDDKDELKKQVKECRCGVDIRMDEVDNPLVYIKTNTIYFAPTRLNPWDKDYKGAVQKLD